MAQRVILLALIAIFVWSNWAFAIGNISFVSQATMPNDALNPPLGPNLVYNTHWYAGSLYTGKTSKAYNVLAGMVTPSSPPKANEFYYVLLSVFDNVGSYNQIGISDDFGVWGLTVSYTTGACPNLHYFTSADIMNLNLSTSYVFAINEGNSSTPLNVIQFELINPSESHFWFFNVAETGAQYLIISKEDSCGTSAMPDKAINYQNYEEVYNTSKVNGVPNFDFTFSLNEWCLNDPCTMYAAAQWKAWTSADYPYTVPKGVKVQTSGDVVTIDN